MRNWLQHRLNAAHIYCRLRGCGLPRGCSLFLAALFGKITDRGIYYRRKTP